ncbi:peroxisomal membrane protein 2-like [Genypterus blacodes]|uniref:peroxisomal membrane protein 2-like n=1 Tax=Genypterus blacodes TaxID=154954 RepID=UPI003F766156
MPVQSLPVREAPIHFRLLQHYLLLLKKYPILTKSVTSLLITGPVSHYFYQLMEAWIPSKDPYCIIKRLLLDRLIFAPGFLLIFFFIMNLLEVKGWGDFENKMRKSYWTALKMNWKVWTPFQFININFVPVQFRVLFANMVALFWYAYLASVRK